MKRIDALVRYDPKTATQRTCPRCMVSKPFDILHFAAHKGFSSGLGTYCRECCRKAAAARYQSQKARLNRYSHDYYHRNIGRKREQSSLRLQRYKRETLLHYGKGLLACVCCGEDTFEFLCIDHINGGGNKERQRIKTNTYRWLKANHYPIGYQVLCHNCNMAKGFYKVCPHKR